MTESDYEFDQIDFDPNDEVSYYYGNLTRENVKEILHDATIGTFLIRNSTKDLDQKVLCVKEAQNCINNYKIIYSAVDSTDNDSISYAFYIYGKEDCLFSSIAKILEFYSTHYLNQSPLVKPAFHHKKVIALYDFQENGDPNEDLYFKQGEILTILEYTQGDQWWKAINQVGAVGLIPATLIRRLKPNEWPLNKNGLIEAKLNQSQQITETNSINRHSNEVKHEISNKNQSVNISNQTTNDADVDDHAAADDDNDDDDDESFEESKSCPFSARVIEDYTPSPYEHSHIALKKGQIITVLEMKSIGKWYGQLSTDGKKGLFPFNRVEIIN